MALLLYTKWAKWVNLALAPSGAVRSFLRAGQSVLVWYSSGLVLEGAVLSGKPNFLTYVIKFMLSFLKVRWDYCRGQCDGLKLDI